MAARFKRRDVQLGDVCLSALERVGEQVKPNEPPILLLHGLVAEANTFRGLMSLLPQDRRVLALDLPGAGYSDREVVRSIGFRGVAAIVREAAEQLGLENPVVLGHSHGGAVGLQMATAYPGFLKALILLCPAHPFSGREDALVNFYLSPPGRAFAHLLPRLPTWVHLIAFRHMPGARHRFTLRDLAPYLHTLRAPGTVKHLLKLLSSWKADMQTLREELVAAPVSVPTLLIWGDKDWIVPLTSAEALRHHLATWEMLTLPDVGHLPNEEEPGKCASLIQTWLTKL